MKHVGCSERASGVALPVQTSLLHRTAVHELQTTKHLVQEELMMLLSQVVVRLDHLSRAVSAATRLEPRSAFALPGGGLFP